MRSPVVEGGGGERGGGERGEGIGRREKGRGMERWRGKKKGEREVGPVSVKLYPEPLTEVGRSDILSVI